MVDVLRELLGGSATDPVEAIARVGLYLFLIVCLALAVILGQAQFLVPLGLFALAIACLLAIAAVGWLIRWH